MKKKKRRYDLFPNDLRYCLLKPICMAVLIFGIALLSVKADAAAVTLAWEKNTAPDLKGYKIYYGTSSKNYDYCINVINATSCVISGLASGMPYYFAATAYNSSGVESAYSNQVLYIPTVTTGDSVGGSETLSPSDFKYSDSAFGNTQNGLYASGAIEGEALKVTLGGVDNINISSGISGGWSGSFDVESNGYVTLSFRYRLVTTRYDADECNQVWIAVDGNFVGRNGEDYIDQICGIGDSGWQQVALEVYLSGGTHRLIVGGFNNQKTGQMEVADVQFEDIEIIQ